MQKGTEDQLRRLTPRGTVTQGRIISATAALIAMRGISGTTLEDIMSESRVSKSQLYHYFDDKNAIIEAVVRHQAAQVIAAQLSQLDKIESMATLRRWCDALVDLSRARGNKGGCPLGTLASELADASESARIALVTSFEIWAAHIEKGLNTMQLRGELTAAADPKELAVAMLSAIQGGLLLTKTTRTEEPLVIALEMALAYVGTFVPRSAG